MSNERAGPISLDWNDVAALIAGGGGAGSMGPTGPAGVAGIDGADGEQGVPGQPGAQGAAGATGASGPTGPAGPPGVDGEQGEQGQPGSWLTEVLALADLSDVTAKTGTGTVVVMDTGPTINELKVSGSIRDTANKPVIAINGAVSAVNYLDVTNAVTGSAPVIKPGSAIDPDVNLDLAGLGTGKVRVGGSEVATKPYVDALVGSRRNEEGPSGDDGWPGPPGVAGVAGAPGVTGAQGPIGPVFLDDPVEGEPGAMGPPGAQGLQGLTGAQGPLGPVFLIDPLEGDPGAMGPPGAQGLQGVTGAQGPTAPAFGIMAYELDRDSEPWPTQRSAPWKPAGGAFPTNPDDGDFFVRTDLEQPNEFAWDAGRAKWLSIALFMFECNTANTFAAGGSVYFDFYPGTIMSGTEGWQLPFDCTVVGCNFHKSEATLNLTVRLRRNGTNTFNKAFAAGTDKDVQSNAENTDIAACTAVTDCWSAFAQPGGNFTAGGAYARFYLRRKGP